MFELTEVDAAVIGGERAPAPTPPLPPHPHPHPHPPHPPYRKPPPKIECKDKNLTPWDGPVKFLFLPDEYKSVAVLLIPPASVKVTQLPAEDTTAHVAIKLSDPLILGDERQQRSVSVTAFDHNGAYVVEIAVRINCILLQPCHVLRASSLTSVPCIHFVRTPKHRPKGKLSTKDCHRGRLPRRAYQLRRPEPAPSSTIVRATGWNGIRFDNGIATAPCCSRFISTCFQSRHVKQNQRREPSPRRIIRGHFDIDRRHRPWVLSHPLQPTDEDIKVKASAVSGIAGVRIVRISTAFSNKRDFAHVINDCI
ncbi:LOW QUALITY PROTEIN: hypothetical protein BC936DRAFT_149629 [Jimgerdemannia flammicorona]|uniref:Uncharacterized protein n=1 Tax=Jimgerdemannia flammicorona TaxID=994334 RepID=A0A433D0G2_9FUNG|nr:LOW QUALITY PROTEIN: hypothetical protein BC936DRAFT_149629 [Jimgerdemannia flammicorona]